jgi:hypothetical protein
MISFISSTIIEDIKTQSEARKASITYFYYFYFDFRNASKQGLHDLLPSLTQLSVRSSPRSDILFKIYSDLDSGTKQPSDSDSTKCLKDMLTLPRSAVTSTLSWMHSTREGASFSEGSSRPWPSESSHVSQVAPNST